MPITPQQENSRTELLRRLQHPGDCTTEELVGYIMAIGYLTSYKGVQLVNRDCIATPALIQHLQSVESAFLVPAKLICFTLMARTLPDLSQYRYNYRVWDAATGILCFSSCPLKDELSLSGFINERRKFPPEPSSN